MWAAERVGSVIGSSGSGIEAVKESDEEGGPFYHGTEEVRQTDELVPVKLGFLSSVLNTIRHFGNPKKVEPLPGHREDS